MTVPPPPRRLLGALFLGTLLAALDIALVGPALPAISEAFELDERAAAWIFGAFVLANLAGLPVTTALSDRRGRRGVFAASAGVFAAGAVTVALAPSFTVLLVGRVVQGLGASGLFPVATAVVGDVYPPERRGRPVGILGAVFGLAFLVGPALAGLVLSVANWRWLFTLLLPLAAIVLWHGLRALPDTRAAQPRPPDLLGTALLVAALVAFALGVGGLDAQALRASLVRPVVWGPLAAGLAAAAAFLVAERRAANPLVRPGLVARRAVQIACALGVGAGLVEATFVFLPAYAVGTFGVTRAEASYLLLPLVGAMALASPVAGRLLDRLGPAPVVGTGMALLGVGMAGVAAAPLLALHVAATVAVGLGLAGVLGSSLSYILLAEAGADERAVAQGLSTIALTVGQLLGAAGVGAVAASAAVPEQGFRAAFAVVGGLAFALAFAALGLRRKPSSHGRGRAPGASAEARPAEALPAGDAG
ncbi:MAG: MFS transporter [Rubricoccaceae bacterium]